MVRRAARLRIFEVSVGRTRHLVVAFEPADAVRLLHELGCHDEHWSVTHTFEGDDLVVVPVDLCSPTRQVQAAPESSFLLVTRIARAREWLALYRAPQVLSSTSEDVRRETWAYLSGATPRLPAQDVPPWEDHE